MIGMGSSDGVNRCESPESHGIARDREPEFGWCVVILTARSRLIRVAEAQVREKVQAERKALSGLTGSDKIRGCSPTRELIT